MTRILDLARLSSRMEPCDLIYRGKVTSINLESDSQGDLALRPEHPEQIIAMAFSMAAEIEHDLMSQRTKESLRFKTAQGMKLGRPMGSGKSKLDPYRPEIESLLANGHPKVYRSSLPHDRGQLHNWLKKHGLKSSMSHPVA